MYALNLDAFISSFSASEAMYKSSSFSVTRLRVESPKSGMDGVMIWYGSVSGVYLAVKSSNIGTKPNYKLDPMGEVMNGVASGLRENSAAK